MTRMEESPPPSPIPITLLSGFLGTGKTTTLQYLLENKDNLRIGVIVNDVASINIDRKLLAKKKDNNEDGIIELQNGCVCCSLNDELVTSVERLVEERQEDNNKLDAIVVELSGVADPGVIEAGWQLSEKATIARIVTIIDANSFGSDYMATDLASQRPGWTPENNNNEDDEDEDEDPCSTNNQMVSQLLADQVESADLILLNKVDLAEDSQIEVVSKVVRALNDRAKVMTEVKYGRVSPRVLLGLDTDTDDASCKKEPTPSGGCCSNPKCSTSSSSSSSSNDEKDDNKTTTKVQMTTKKLGFVNFVYEASRPFDNERIMTLLEQWPISIQDKLELHLDSLVEEDDEKNDATFAGIVRSKGFCWLAPTKWTGDDNDAWRHNGIVYWSFAGRQFDLSHGGWWWAGLGEEAMHDFFPSQDELERMKQEDFKTEEFGDRRQEIVIIGTNIQQDAINKAFDSCLLTDEEMKDYRSMIQQGHGDTITMDDDDDDTPAGEQSQ